MCSGCERLKSSLCMDREERQVWKSIKSRATKMTFFPPLLFPSCTHTDSASLSTFAMTFLFSFPFLFLSVYTEGKRKVHSHFYENVDWGWSPSVQTVWNCDFLFAFSSIWEKTSLLDNPENIITRNPHHHASPDCPPSHDRCFPVKTCRSLA